MCVHAGVCPFGVWHLARGSPPSGGDARATRLARVAWGTPPVLVLRGRGWGEQACACMWSAVQRPCGVVSCPPRAVPVLGPACMCSVCATPPTNPQHLIRPQDCALTTRRASQAAAFFSVLNFGTWRVVIPVLFVLLMSNRTGSSTFSVSRAQTVELHVLCVDPASDTY